MSLKDLTWEKHQAAENTLFMKRLFNQTLPIELWIDWTYQKWLIYGAIEGSAGACGLLSDLPDLRRTFKLFNDYQEMNQNRENFEFKQSTKDYYHYLMNLYPDCDRVKAHLYVWHLGDMFGGQMIKKLIPGSHTSLEFENRMELIGRIKSKLDDSAAEEANVAFDWAIKILEEYNSDLEQNNSTGH
jgi:heme oxygenase